MKKFGLLFLFMAFVAFSFGQISGSAHDFSGNAWSGGEICIACHTPHDADVTIAESPLWNHDITAATYTLYTSNTLDATMAQPSGISKLCLSCHDGTVALDSYGGATGTNFIAATGLVGEAPGYELGSEHPISFLYQSSIDAGDTGLNPTTDGTAMGGTIATDLLSGGNVECISCHDVHNSQGNASLLKIDNAGSALCLECHAK